MKLAVLFPGLGYTVYRPLLYYAGKLAGMNGYQVTPVTYPDFPRDVKGDAVRMQACFVSAYDRAEETLRDIPWHGCEDILFIGKSIGTTVAARYAKEHGIPARLVLLTPLEDTFRFTEGAADKKNTAIAFHGTADPWAATDAIVRACRERNIPLYLTEGANHSLETGDVNADLAALVQTMKTIEAFLAGKTGDR